MKHLLALALLLVSVHEATALETATEQELTEINAQLIKKNAAQKALQAQMAALINAGDDEELKGAIQEQIVVLEKERKNAAEQAIWLTMRAYDIIPFRGNEPQLPKGISVFRSPEEGTRIVWLPVFEDIGKKLLQDKSGNPAGERNVGSRVAGNTASDGISRIFPGAFDSPVELASYIIHEQRHFIQNTTRRQGDEMTTAEMEVAAYE